ncbi:MAG: DEAD/DEAH box helicase [Planctomycetes bacterium]|nr:DEAD/DEAH box helicase [Planctomycetota bacterium]
MHFDQFGLSEPILRAVGAEGYTTPTPIQAKAIPPVMEGRDLVGIAQTGTGKTAAFALPILHRLAQGQPRNPRQIRCLVLAPTRELAAQVGDSFRTYGNGQQLRSTVIFGGVGQNPQVQALRTGVDICVACPGRLLDLIQQGHCRLDHVSILVLDEADRMLDMGFMPDIKRIVQRVPQQRQTLLFSATMPREIRELASSMLRDPVEVSVAPVSSAAETVAQSVYHVPKSLKQSLLNQLLQGPGVERAIVFTRTKHGADKVVRKLAQVGIRGEAIHGNKSQNQRIRALDAFKKGQIRVLVASDIAARGLDVDGITHVVNFDIPNEPETYVHRIGRTGRAGATGTAWSLCDGEERAYLKDIERIMKRQVPVAPLPTDLPPAPPDLPNEFRPQRGGGGSGFGRRPHGHAPERPQDPHRSGHGQPGRRNGGRGFGGGGGGGGGRGRSGPPSRSSSW